MVDRSLNSLASTEGRSGERLDLLTPLELARAFQRADLQAAQAVAGAEAEIARAIELAAEALGAGGRLVLSGAGTSGRLAVLESAECLPTFSSTRVVGLMAGGSAALLRAREGAEDDRAGGRDAALELELDARDFVLAIAASGRTPFAWGTLDAAASVGAKRGLLCCSAPPPGEGALDVTIHLRTGPELLTGSTRLKAGTATKCALNAISTGAMARLGKVYDDLMVDVVASNAKLRLRARRIVASLSSTQPSDGSLSEASLEEAGALIEAAEGEVKTAIVMGRLGLDADGARARLEEQGGHLRRALGEARA